jgi:hypothetical protein
MLKSVGVLFLGVAGVEVAHHATMRYKVHKKYGFSLEIV